ncbi:MAG: hypothetical protein Kow0063_08940 [Anaerolineae bacterium]
MVESGADDDRTVVSSPSPKTPPQKRNPWLWVALGGCAAILCLALVVLIGLVVVAGGGEAVISLGGDRASPTREPVSTPTVLQVETGDTAEPSRQPTATEKAGQPEATESPPTGTKPPSPAPQPTRTPTQIPTATSTPEKLEPSIGPITFATDVTPDNQPVNAATTFASDIQEIHAIFDYAGMSESDTWERRWYQDGQEVGSGSGRWDAGESGTFDLSLTGGGEPLGPGDWRLEIYVNGELMQAASFLIEAGATPTATAPPVARTYQLAFARWDGGKHNLYIANTDGSGERFLLERAAGPSWSPDGQYLSIYGEEGVDRQVRGGVEYVVEGITNGILWLKVANFPDDITQVEMGQYVREGSGRWTAWAPNGKMVAFDATRGGPDRRIYFLGTADNQQYNIEIPGEQAAWSPDSNRLVYRSGRDGKQGIWISNRDDSGAHNITSEGNDSFPSWSPDGRTIAFHREVGGNVDIYAMNPDGSNIRRLTDAPGPDTLPAWTPDGRIVFRSARTGSWGIYIMNADGSGQRQIIANADPGPDWAFGRMEVH